MARPDPQEQLRSRILEEFERRAAHEGPRAVVMAELARDLGISTRTLYQVFESKAAVVQAIMDEWVAETEADDRALSPELLTVAEQVREGALAWMDAQNRFSRAFWSQVRRDFPEAVTRADQKLGHYFGRAAQIVLSGLRDDVLPGIAIPMLMNTIEQASKPSFCDRLGISRQESVTRAIEIWCRGCLAPEKKASGRPLSIVRDPS